MVCCPISRPKCGCALGTLHAPLRSIDAEMRSRKPCLRAFDKMRWQSVKNTHKTKQRSTHPVVVGAIAKVLNFKAMHNSLCTCPSAVGRGWRKTNGEARMRETTQNFK